MLLGLSVAGYLAKGHNLSELLPTPHAGMHNKWLQAAMRPKYDCLLPLCLPNLLCILCVAQQLWSQQMQKACVLIQTLCQNT